MHSFLDEVFEDVGYFVGVCFIAELSTTAHRPHFQQDIFERHDKGSCLWRVYSLFTLDRNSLLLGVFESFDLLVHQEHVDLTFPW
ncbi:hypothetical protein D3C80_1570100 [compost metagenome]